MVRSSWCMINDTMIEYHDKECGVPLHDDQKQFENLFYKFKYVKIFTFYLNSIRKSKDIRVEVLNSFDMKKIKC